MKKAFLLLGLLGVAASATAADSIVHAGWLVANPDDAPVKQQSIFITDGKVSEIKNGFVEADNIIDLSCCYVMPGFTDLHTHLTINIKDTAEDADNVMKEILAMQMRRPTKIFAEAIPRAKRMLQLGFTAVRNLGDPASVSYDLRDAINNGAIDGPRMYATEPQFNVGGGDYDPVTLSLHPEAAAIIDTRGLCGGVEDCRNKVRSEIRRGADVIKLRFSGLARMDREIDYIEYEDELKAIIDTAHKLNRTVAAHVVGPASIDLAVKLGVDSIEHGPLAPPNMKAMAEKGTTYVPTIAPLMMNSAMIKKITGMDVETLMAAVVSGAYKSGVPIGFGSDQGALPVSSVPEEFALMHNAGLPLSEVLRSTTVTAAKTLGKEDVMGTIAVGKYADLVASPLNPLEDINAYTDIAGVVKEGRSISLKN